MTAIATVTATSATQWEWQPIETAPTGATILLGWTDSRRVDIGWRRTYAGKRARGMFSTHGQTGVTPTHWMPLPAPPGAES